MGGARLVAENSSSAPRHAAVDLLGDPPTPALRLDWADYERRARAYAQNARAPNTRRAYASDVAHFTRWAQARGFAGLPCEPGIVLAYLIDEAARVSVATLDRRLAALREAHRTFGVELETGRAAFREAWTGIRRAHRARPKRKAPLRVEDLRQAVLSTPETLTGWRDRALLLVGFGGGLRRSELAGLTIGGDAASLSFVDGGLLVRLDASKTDQGGRGQEIAIPAGVHSETCPVQALRRWLEEGRICEGSVFRGVDRWGGVSGEGISDRSVALIVKRAVFVAARSRGLGEAEAVALARQFAGHSLRSGLATAAAAADAPGHLIQRHLRHAKFDTTLAYIREGERFKKNAATFVGL